MSDEIQALLSGYAVGTLTAHERRRLFVAALADQPVFDALVEEDGLRELLADPELRREALAALGPAVLRPPLWQRPAVWAAAGVAAAAALVIAVLPMVWLILPTPGPLSTPIASPKPLSRGFAGEPDWRSLLFELPLAQPFEASLVFNKKEASPAYRAGEPMRLGLLVQREARVVVVERRADGTLVTLLATTRVAAGQRVLIPPAGSADLVVSGPPGPSIVRLVAFPPEVEPSRLGAAELGRLVGRIAVVEKSYTVER